MVGKGGLWSSTGENEPDVRERLPSETGQHVLDVESPAMSDVLRKSIEDSLGVGEQLASQCDRKMIARILGHPPENELGNVAFSTLPSVSVRKRSGSFWRQVMAVVPAGVGEQRLVAVVFRRAR